jgi:phosphatidylserine/phosphatidylglycerophosphate/cardiolipin synthase-like enzyme
MVLFCFVFFFFSCKALEGIPVRIVVWRHQLLSYLNRFLYLGDVTIESEVTRLVERGKQLGVHVVMIHSSSGVSASSFSGASAFADPHLRQLRPTITIVIVGNPRGVLSSHHEKLVLVDAECAAGHGVAFIGGFDIARGRYDQPLHQIPLPYFELNPAPSKAARFTGPAVQPVLRRIRFLWHDVQVELSNGPVVQQLQLHFAQRWIFAFSGNVAETRSYFLPPARALCQLQPTPRLQEQPIVQLSRCWRGVLDVQKMFEVHRQAIRR